MYMLAICIHELNVLLLLCSMSSSALDNDALDCIQQFDLKELCIYLKFAQIVIKYAISRDPEIDFIL